MEERPKHSVVTRNPPGCQSSRRISRTSRRSSSIGCRSLMIGRRSSAGLLAWTSCQDPSRVNTNLLTCLKSNLYNLLHRYLHTFFPTSALQFKIVFSFCMYGSLCNMYSYLLLGTYQLRFINLDFFKNILSIRFLQSSYNIIHNV